MNKRGYKDMVRGIDAQRVQAIVDAYVHSDRDREIIKLNLLHGVSYTHIADQLDPWLSPRSIQEVMNRWMPVIIEHLQR